MEPRPASPCTEHTLQQGLLISALLLTIWNPLTTAQLTIESVPRHAVEGKNLLLQVHKLLDNLQGYYWYRGEIVPSNMIARLSLNNNISIPGNAYTGKETIQPDGALLIEKFAMTDTGVYILQTVKTDLDTEEASVEIHVYQQNPQGGLPVWAVVITVTGVLVLILVTALGCFLFLTKTSRARVQHDLRDPQTPVSASRPGASNSYVLAPVSSHREDTPVYQELVHPDMNIYDRINYTADVTS